MGELHNAIRAAMANFVAVEGGVNNHTYNDIMMATASVWWEKSLVVDLPDEKLVGAFREALFHVDSQNGGREAGRVRLQAAIAASAGGQSGVEDACVPAT